MHLNLYKHDIIKYATKYTVPVKHETLERKVGLITETHARSNQLIVYRINTLTHYHTRKFWTGPN